MEVFRKKASVLLTVVGFAIFYIFVTALFMFNVELSANPENGQLFFEDFLMLYIGQLVHLPLWDMVIFIQFQTLEELSA